ncbi:MAG: AAA family ATPase [Acidobacteriota bacterium]
MTTEMTIGMFTVKSGNAWMRTARRARRPAEFVGQMWREGELVLVFGDTESGANLLAAQIAESIACGKPLGEMANTSKPQKVLYVDLSITEAQFQMRYSAMGDDDDDERSKSRRPKRKTRNSYDFSDNFLRMAPQPDDTEEKGSAKAGEYLSRAIKKALADTGAKVLVIGDISILRRSNYGTSEAAELFMNLRKMRERFGISILVTAQTARRQIWRPMSVVDLGSLRFLASSADSVIAIGQSRVDSDLRYLKQVKACDARPAYDTEHLPVFRIGRIEDNFLGFDFEELGSETEHISVARDSTDWKLIDEMHGLAASGKTQREIADMCRTSKTRVNRLLSMRRPVDRPPSAALSPLYVGLEKCIYDECKGCFECNGRSGRGEFEPLQRDVYEHGDCPDHCEVCGPRAYRDGDDVAPELKLASDEFFSELRAWLVSGKTGERPKYRPPVSVTEDELAEHKRHLLRNTLKERSDTHNAMVSMGYSGDRLFIKAKHELFSDAEGR